MYANKVNNPLNEAGPLGDVLRVLPLRWIRPRGSRGFVDPVERAAFARSLAAQRAVAEAVPRRQSG